AINMTAFAGFLNELAPGLITPAVDGRFDFDPATGQMTVVQPAISGRTLNIEQTLARLEDGVFTAENRIVPMAFDYTLPRFHNQITAAELGIFELVAESTTYYNGSSANRRHNIAVGASRLNGVIIAPGEEFSFNYYIGEISAENGFVEGLVIFGGRTVNGLGGGICQVSTTMFRAAFTGGFAITERNSHGYRVGYYELGGAPPGLDAAIWQPERDFKFQNNTPYHILIEAEVQPANNALQIRIYSTQHWQTQLEDPIVRDIVPAPAAGYEANSDLRPGEVVQVDYAADGADVTIYRNVYDMQGNLVVEDYAYTHYVPWQAIYQVAPGDSRLGS
ncbi:MAG: VanW family protein, partial [Anaerolineae bacterium]|nr:VanW family protein [Anaerolineae bacterium]